MLDNINDWLEAWNKDIPHRAPKMDHPSQRPKSSEELDWESMKYRNSPLAKFFNLLKSLNKK